MDAQAHEAATSADGFRNTVAASERERRRWARELHDDTLQRLGAMRLRLAVARRGPPTALAPVVEDAIAELAEQIADLRSLIDELSPVALDDLGLAAAVASLAHEHEAHTGLRVDLDLSGWRDGRGLEPEPERTLFRVAQEALANVAAHADASRVELRLRRSEAAAEVTVRDDGRGIDGETRSGGLGLRVLAERLALFGGVLRIESAPGGGTTLSARVQCSAAERRQSASEPSRPRPIA